MEHSKELTLQDLMQLSHDIKEIQKDFDMIMEFMEDDEIKTILKEENNE